MKTPRTLVSFTLTLALGCASAEHTTDPTSSETAFQSGSLVGAVTGLVGQAQTTNSSHVTLTGLVANFTRLGIAGPGGSPGTSAVYFATRGDSGAPHLWRENLDGTELRQLTSDSSGQLYPAISRAGGRLVFRDLKLSAGQPTATDLWEWTEAGGPRFLAAETGVTGIAGWVPGDTAIVYPVNAGSDVGLRQRGLPSGPVTHLTDLPDDRLTTGVVDGVPTVFFTRGRDILRINLVTHDTTVFYNHPDFASGFSPDLSRDGTQLLYWTQDVRNFTLFIIPTDKSDSAQQLDVFPDRGLLWHPEARWSGDTAVVQTVEQARAERIVPQLGLRSVHGPLLKRLTDFPAGIENGFSVGASLASAPRELVGADGVLGSTASGIIFGQGSPGGLTSVLSFTANRQRSVSLTAGTGLNASAPVLTYTVTADRLTGLAYLNDPPSGAAVTVIDSTSAPASGALISFDATTGAVALVLPFSAGGVSNAESASVADERGARVFRGRFTGVWQGGQNLAPGGANEVRLVFEGSVVEVRGAP